MWGTFKTRFVERLAEAACVLLLAVLAGIFWMWVDIHDLKRMQKELLVDMKAVQQYLIEGDKTCH